jgi:hypothetical protein
MNPIYVLWATPRSTSTAFEWMMRMRGDLACFHEPFGEAWYQGDDARAPRLNTDSPCKPGPQRSLTFDDGQLALISLLRQFFCRGVFSAVVTGKRLPIAVESND